MAALAPLQSRALGSPGSASPPTRLRTTGPLRGKPPPSGASVSSPRPVLVERASPSLTGHPEHHGLSRGPAHAAQRHGARPGTEGSVLTGSRLPTPESSVSGTGWCRAHRGIYKNPSVNQGSD